LTAAAAALFTAGVAMADMQPIPNPPETPRSHFGHHHYSHHHHHHHHHHKKG
jgi:hypothetical protein